MTYKDKNGLNYLRKKIIIELSKLWVMTNTEKKYFSREKEADLGETL